jgi:hypothetical protein
MVWYGDHELRVFEALWRGSHFTEMSEQDFALLKYQCRMLL